MPVDPPMQEAQEPASDSDMGSEDALHSYRRHACDLAITADERAEELARLRRERRNLERELDSVRDSLEAWSQRADSLEELLSSMLHSTSWRFSKPVRQISRLLRGRFREARESLRGEVNPLAHRPRPTMPISPVSDTGGPTGPGLEKGLASGVSEVPASALAGELIDLEAVAADAVGWPGGIAVHMHVRHEECVEELAGYLANVPDPFDLFVSCTSATAAAACEQAFASLEKAQASTIRVVPDRGRDLAPMLCEFREAFRGYTVIGHIHTLMSDGYRGDLGGWRPYLLRELMGSSLQVRRILSLLGRDDRIGLVFPQPFFRLPYRRNSWLSNLALGRVVAERIGVEQVPTGYFSFPSGSMFWARGEALRPLLDAAWTLDDFPLETGQSDGTMVQALERMLALSAHKAGYRHAILGDRLYPSWSPWRFDRYLDRTTGDVHAAITAPHVRLVAFDIFDTLISRPLLNPEHVKDLVAERIGGDEGRTYRSLRARAESEARGLAGRDIGFDAIYQRFASLSGLSQDTVDRMRREEEAVELAAVGPRAEVIALIATALRHGKRVALVSDMYLPRQVIEAMLQRCGVRGWQAFYLSSEIGVRKDTGDLYRHLLEQESLLPGEIVMLGDNEQSDVQIPEALGIRCEHVLRPVELARSLPRLRPLIDSGLQGGDLDTELTLGLIARAQFHPLTYPDFDPQALTLPTPWATGYAVLGPLAFAFVRWLSEKAAADGIERLYFLAREGQFLKLAFERYQALFPGTVESRYLVVSRRAVTVPALRSFEDFESIARTRYYPNFAPNFLKERFGVEVTPEEIDAVWEPGRAVKVEDGDTTAVAPLLRHFEGRILEQSRSESSGLLAYLEQCGLGEGRASAVVDIGYSATIQGYLNRLLGSRLDGYYMATTEAARALAEQQGVSATGCFAQFVPADSPPIPLYHQSFELEKLLSSDDPQIVSYGLEADGSPNPAYAELSREERATRGVRAAVQAGAMEFIEEALKVKAELWSPYTPSLDLVSRIYEAWVQNPSARERQILERIVLDDHYCGRGLVS